MKFFDCLQGSDEWFGTRRGIPTASMFKTVIANGRGGEPSKTRATYMRTLAGEIITGEPSAKHAYRNEHMDRGNEMEDEARSCYCFMTGQEAARIGFITNDVCSVGASPDSFVSRSGILEIKTALPHILIEIVLRDSFPPEHKPQVQGQLMVAEREWADLIVFWPKMTPFIKRTYRDETYIKMLAEEVDRFNYELAEMVERIRRYQPELYAEQARSLPAA